MLSFYLAFLDGSKKLNQDKKGVYIITTEEKLNQPAGTIKEGVKKTSFIKKFMIFIHIMRVELCRICYNVSTHSVIIVYQLNLVKEQKMSVQISIRVSKEQKEKFVELAKNENKTITQYILDRCIVENSYTEYSSVDDASNRVETVLQEQIKQLRADFDNERRFYISQIDEKDGQIADILETNNNQLQLIGALTIKNETLLLETKKSWWQRLFSKR